MAQRADIQNGIQRLKMDTGGAAKVSTNPATGAARFVRVASGSDASLSRGLKGTPAEKSAAFFRTYGNAFGITNPSAQLRAAGQVSDVTGGQHLTYTQVYQGVPVYAGIIKTHFDANGELRSVNGNFIPDISLNAIPSHDASALASIAIERVKSGIADDNANAELIPRSTEGLSVRNSTLYIFRENLTLQAPGVNHLAYEMEVVNGTNVREFVFVNAHTGKVVGQYTGIYDALNRRAFDGQGSTSVPPPNYPNNPFWVEGQALPTGNAEADNMITSSKEVYDYYLNAYGRDSYDGNGAVLDAIFNRGNACPNASWNGLFISFCPGLTTDDVTAHEWSHAYTERTHGLIYAHQSGALNEAYSDIHGETVDQINGRGGDSPNTNRTVGFCSSLMPAAPITRVNLPVDVAADYPSGTSAFSPAIVEPGVTSDLVRPNDGATTTGAGNTLTDGCSNAANFVDDPGGTWANKAAVAGHVVLMDRGLCGFQVKALNAQRNGAIGVIIGNVATSGSPNTAPNMGATAIPGAEAITIPVVSMSNPNASLLRAKTDAATPVTVNATLKPRDSENSVRWLLGEDDTNPQLFGALRDMWNPVCAGNPGKVSDVQYSCAAIPSGANDQGGVHNNSGVINHMYALVVDGGTYNGHTVNGIGLTKAAHIYFRAQNLYQHPSSSFSDHGDALEQAAQDLITAGTNLPKLTDGTPSGEIVTAADLAQIQEAELAVELRTVPVACTATPLLNQNTPADTCGANTTQSVIFSDDFEGSTAGWTATHVGNTAGFTPRDWSLSSDLPDGRAGKGFFGPDPGTGACIGNSNEAGIIHLTSPSIHIPSTATNRTLRFDHWVSLERNFDGGQLRVSTDGGANFTLVPQANYTFNAPNVTLPSGASTFDNPMAGQRAFSGTDGFTTDGSWATSIVDLGALAPAGSDIVLRWSVGTDCASGAAGWYLDNVKLSSCLTNTDLSIIKKASTTSTKIGTDVVYTLTVKNNGPTNATSVVITDPLPMGLSFVSADGGCTEAAGTVTCNIGDLANGASVVRHITVKTIKVGKIVNTATLSLFEPDTVVPGNNSGGAAVNVLAWLKSVTFSPTSVVGGCASSTGTILLTGAAPVGGLDVQLVSANPDVVVPASPVHINAGATSQTFTATTSAVNASKVVNVTATVVGTATSVIGKLKLTPVPIVSVTFSPNPVTGGNQTTGTVTLSCAAPYNISVTLLSNKSAAKPATTTINIPMGATSAPFTVNTLHVLSQTVVTFTAKGNTTTKTGTLTVVP